MAFSVTFFCDTCGAANRMQAVYCSACGRPLQTNASHTITGLLVRQHILRQRYRITGQIGQGGFGAVYRAEDLDFGDRAVAIKEMSQGSLSPQELIDATNAFKREALLLANLTHPNLPRIYEQFTDTGRRYLVMDFIDGETLEDYLKQYATISQSRQIGNPPYLPIEKVLDIGIQLCAVLDYLHTRQPPIIFRDLKPANIMISPGGHIYLIDFGIARHFKPGQAKDTTALGSSGYAAPEQYGKAQSTPRSDIYGLGAVLHQLLSGNDPSDSPFQFAPLPLGNHPAMVAFAHLVKQMLEMDASNRPASASNVKQELQRIASLYFGTSTHPLQPIIPSTPQPATMAPLPVASPPPGNTLYTCKGHNSRVTAVAWSPDGKRIATASYDKKVRLWDAATGNAGQTYRGHTERVHTVAWSPDSTRLATAGADGKVHIWVATSGTLLLTYQGHSAPIHALAWSPDGRRVASASDDKTAHVWEAVPGGRVFIYRGHQAAVTTIGWSPDGKRVISGSADRTIQTWDPAKEGGLLTSLLRLGSSNNVTYRGHTGRVNAVAWSRDGKRIASVGSDRFMQVWDIATGKLIFTHHNHAASLNAVAWSPDSRYLASGGNDKLVYVWDSITRNAILTYTGHTGHITSLCWSPDGKLIASTGVDRTTQVWKV